MIEGRREGGRDEHRGRKIKTEEETKARKGREGKGRGREGKGEQKEKKETKEEVAGPYLDTKATQREERDQGTIGRCGTRVVPASTNRHRRPPPMPGPIHRSGLAKRKAFEPSPGSEDPCRSLLSLSLSLLSLRGFSPPLLPLPPGEPACMADAKPPCQLSMHHLDEPNSCSSTRPLSDTLSPGIYVCLSIGRIPRSDFQSPSIVLFFFSFFSF